MLDWLPILINFINHRVNIIRLYLIGFDVFGGCPNLSQARKMINRHTNTRGDLVFYLVIITHSIDSSTFMRQ